MPELPNFVHVTRSKIKFELHDEILLVTSWTERHNLHFKILYFKKA